VSGSLKKAPGGAPGLQIGRFRGKWCGPRALTRRFLDFQQAVRHPSLPHGHWAI